MESSCEVERQGFKSESWHFSWLWAHHLSSLVFGDFLCKIKIKTLYTIPTSQGCCENQVKMYVKALCNFVIFQSPHFPWVLPSPYQIQYYNLPEGCTLILHFLLPYKWMVQRKWSTCPPGYLVLVWEFWCLKDDENIIQRTKAKVLLPCRHSTSNTPLSLYSSQSSWWKTFPKTHCREPILGSRELNSNDSWSLLDSSCQRNYQPLQEKGLG